MLAGLIHRFFPASSLADEAPAAATPIESDRAISPSRRWLLLGVVLLMTAVVAALILWGHWGTAAAPLMGSAPAADPVIHPTDTASQEAAIRETLARYNAAETEAAALLRIDPLTPYLASDGPFATRRAAELAERQRQHAPHRSILLRWGIGTITVNGDTATAVTQETWSNQEAGAVAAEQATVRVTYILRWDATAGRWLIVDTSQMPL